MCWAGRGDGLGAPVMIFALAGVVTEDTGGPDVILGTAGADVIRGNGGDDLMATT